MQNDPTNPGTPIAPPIDPTNAGIPMTSREERTPMPAEESTPLYIHHGAGEHSHKHQHGGVSHHLHRHQHEDGDAEHAHDPGHELHEQTPEHMRFHMGA